MWTEKEHNPNLECEGILEAKVWGAARRKTGEDSDYSVKWFLVR
jgi:hypothetical protein